jgi:SAM-dependent methyltransferase
MRNTLPRNLARILALLLVSLAAGAQGKLRNPDVVYVPTGEEVVAEMLRMAEVSSDDLVYDLGCGDGRLVITAAKEYGARGVGIDIDPERIKDSRKNAAEAGVTDRVKFILGDLFQADFHNATAVTIYLLPDLNVRLRPMLFEQLKPGTPVVSHDFDMGEWAPDETRTVWSGGRNHTVYKWLIPAKVEGVWRFTGPDGKSYDLALQQRFQELTADLRSNGRDTRLTDIQLVGDNISFKLPDTGQRFVGRLRTGVLHGTMSGPDGRQTAQWTAHRLQTAAASQ